ncbi:MAG: hypothetical protein BWY43_00411 [candidate division WS2 bacterium ADurb.Bin280]|uniref:Uncharacterized protein n=1 Tax=candidate division WS2 bacterium ADurb.Bin280 TaxID=1852829 RepID=A0A1V5SF29_9BACT|nr:MAG: hypothetical protein BWY43_00411 [candidate division WS2 bacterium ADurb.Bin280]
MFLSDFGRKGTNRSIVYLVIFSLAILTSFGLFRLPKRATAGVNVNGNSISISGGVYTIDDDGFIYSDPGLFIKEADINGVLKDLPKEYYSYLFNKMYDSSGNALRVGSDTDLTIEAGAVAIMEGSQQLNSLTVRGAIKQPFPDREGKINKPIYTTKNWGGRITGFLKLEAGRSYKFYNEGTNAPLAVEVSSGSTIDSSTSWSLVLRESGNWSSSTGWANRWSSCSVGHCSSEVVNASSADKYIPIRISFASYDRADLDLRVISKDLSDPMQIWSASELARSSFFGKGTNNSVDSSKAGVSEFEFFVSKENTYPYYGFSNSVETAQKVELDLYNDFDAFGDNDSTLPSSNRKMKFSWSQGSPTGASSVITTPLGRIFGTHSTKRASIYSTQILNEKAFDPVRRISAGLSLDVKAETLLEQNGKIDLIGRGYPGYSGEMTAAIYRKNGAGPGGGYTNLGCNGSTATGGSHAGKGGFNLSNDNNCRSYNSSPPTYGNASDPSTLGSGAGAASDADGTTNIAGSGGGLLRLNTGSLTFKDSAMIDVGGSAGEYVDWHTNAGGSGGSANIVVNGSLNVEHTGTIIGASGSSGKVTDYNLHDYIGGGGGYVLLRYASSMKDKSTIENQIDVTGGDGGRGSNRDTGGEDWDGDDGVKTVDGALVSGSSLNIIKETYNSSGGREASFEPGDVVSVKIYIYEPGSTDRTDFKIEDIVEGNLSGEIKLNNVKIPSSQYKISNKILEITGSESVKLKAGTTNTISYSYTL